MEIDDQKHEIPEKDQKENDQTPPVDRFTEFMFGARHSRQNIDHQQTNDEIDDVNYLALLEQIDDIMVSLKDLKPMLEQLSPLMDYIKKKI